MKDNIAIKSGKYLKANKGVVVALILLLVVAVLPRVVDLGVFLTADEKNWIGRSYEYIRAFKDWRFNEMLQTTHPGVTTLWLSGAAVTAKMLWSHIPFSFRNLIYFVKVAQWPIALTNALMVGVIYWLLKKAWEVKKDAADMVDGISFVKNRGILAGKRLPLIMGLFIALDPFLVGYSRVVHVDALLGSFLFAAILATIIYGRDGFARGWLVTGAVFTALALLTKAPAVFMVPYLGLVILLYGKGELKKKSFWRDRMRDVVLWSLLISIMVIIIWPAVLWVPNPEGNLLVLKRDIGRAAVTPHNMTEDYSLNGSFYWYVLLTRTTPVGLLLAVVGISGVLLSWWTRRRPQLDDNYRLSDKQMKVMRMILAYVFFFVVMMMLGAKKGDRYILPVFFGLDVLAVYGLWLTASAVVKITGVRRWAGADSPIKWFVVLAGAAVIYLGVTVYHYHPYNISYSDPFLPDNLSQELGWGEGLEQVGAWLSKNDPEAMVASWYPEELGAYTSARVAHINAHEQGKVKYVVLYRNMFGRALDHWANDFIDEYYKKKEPVYVARIAGKEFAWVYEKKVFDHVLGEFKNGSQAQQAVVVNYPNLVGVDVMVATYSGQAKQGEVVVNLIDRTSERVALSWSKKIAEINDKGWSRFLGEAPLDKKGDYLVEVKARQINGRGPTVRYNRSGVYRRSLMTVDGEEKQGNLAVRLIYKVNSGLATEDDVKLLQ